jgi:3-oxoacyl-[acyl-carrier protein] reductase
MAVATDESTALAGQVALVTGSGRGIGRAIAIAYARAGAQVVVTARTRSQIDSVRDEITAAGGTAIAVASDVTDRDGVTTLVAQTIENFGRLDIVVANAGATSPAAPVSPVDDFAYVINVNLLSVHHLALVCEPYLRERGGKLIVMGSGAGRRPFKGGSGYSVSKAAVSMLVRSLAVEWRDASIAVNEIIPGPVRTEMAAGILDVPNIDAAIRMDWHKTPDDVTPIALFLAAQSNDGPSGQVFSLLGRDL